MCLCKPFVVVVVVEFLTSKKEEVRLKEAEQVLLQEAVQARCLPAQVSLFSIVMCSIYLYVEYNC